MSSARGPGSRHPGVTRGLNLIRSSVPRTGRLLNNLRQYSGDAIYQKENTPRQNQQCLRIFDLSEYRQLLSDTAVQIYQDAAVSTV